MSRILSLVVLLSISSAVLSQQVSQRAIVYRGNNQTGQFTIVPATYVPNFTKTVRSVCVTGTWIFYVNQNYNTGATSGVEYVFGSNNYCTNLATLAGNVRSIRFVGSPNDYRLGSFTLFEENYFQGNEEFSYGDLPNLNLAGAHKSIIITGSSAWTVFDQINYGGNSLCLFPQNSADYEPYFIPNVAGVQIPNGSIRSFRKGCVGKQLKVNVAAFGI